MMHITWSGVEQVLFVFDVNCLISGLQVQKNWRFGSDLSIFGLQLQFEFMDGYEMTQIASMNMEEVRYCFSRSPVKFQGH